VGFAVVVVVFLVVTLASEGFLEGFSLCFIEGFSFGFTEGFSLGFSEGSLEGYSPGSWKDFPFQLKQAIIGRNWHSITRSKEWMVEFYQGFVTLSFSAEAIHCRQVLAIDNTSALFRP
jgi:hypothetical protein